VRPDYLAGLAFPALATSSAASASVVGRRDGGLTRRSAGACAIVAATDLPISADLEKRFGAAPSVVAETIRLAAESGVVGCTIEDSTGNPGHPLMRFRLPWSGSSRLRAPHERFRSCSRRAHNFL
jgi:2-methylisocitrate lyase-like PEP mutase family enzyme